MLIAAMVFALAGHLRLAQADPKGVSTQAASAAKLDIRIPLQEKSVRFAVIGDSGTGDRAQYEVAQRMEAYREATKFDFVIMLGDNIYGSHSPRDFVKKFEQPYKPLLDAGVKFYASLGNHDDPDDERLYKPFNMGGERYYAFRKGEAAFFALDSNYMDPKQLSWLGQNLKESQGTWKIAFFTILYITMAGAMVLTPISAHRSCHSSSAMGSTRCSPAMNTCTRGLSRKIIFTTLFWAIPAS